MARLIVLGPNGATSYELKEKTVIGRGLSCDIPLDDGASSRRHCVIEKTDDAFVVVDLGSSNGTRVNSERVSRCALRSDDQIKVGTTVMVFEDEI